MSTADKQEILDGLMANGLRHLERGLRGFEADALDFAVTDAFFGIEIILKALVFDGQWELIFTEPGDAELQALKSGSGRTIGCDQAIKRLTTLLNRSLPPSTAHFKKLQRHRNKLVHFYHPGLFTEREKTQVATDLANAWAALREVQQHQSFGLVFNKHADKFRDLEGRLLLVDTFLDQQAQQIRSAHKEPHTLRKCPACKRATFNGECSLCCYAEPSHRDICKGEHPADTLDCPQCGGPDTIIRFGENVRCKNCGKTFEKVIICEYCQVPFVQRTQAKSDADIGSFCYGCYNCDGHLGELMRRDD